MTETGFSLLHVLCQQVTVTCSLCVSLVCVFLPSLQELVIHVGMLEMLGEELLSEEMSL